MIGRKKEISYYDLGGREAEMYRQIDDILAISKRFSTRGVKRTRRRVLGLCFVIGGLMGAFAVYALIRGSWFGFFCWGIFAIAVFAAGIYYFRTYGNEPFIEVVRSDNIISADGLENVYNDLMHAQQIGKTKIFMGETYLFNRNDCLYRIRDIQQLYIRVVRGDDSTTYYACAKIIDESGTRNLNLKTLSGFTEAQRDKQFAEVVAPIEQVRQRLIKMNDLI